MTLSLQTATKNKIKTHVIIFSLTFLLLTLFHGLYLLIKIKYTSYPEESYYFEGGTPTSGQLLVTGFSNMGVIVESLITSLIVIILNYFIRIKNKGLLVTSFRLTSLVTLIYFVFRLLSARNYDREYYGIFFKELKQEILILTLLFFIGYSFTIALTSKFKKEI
ncbi:hypothetical protein SAMN05660236_4008 [Ohtaekwangia koreensis]|uniref:Uncharacterized protein n=1 Tax=Ohtaekwangia koreensis TaxID=688867 RepID=A0A1T5M109_9BACT|nr:hypothetical protein SAMN05660236_4008 [Ohtaekwangia koreensis]